MANPRGRKVSTAETLTKEEAQRRYIEARQQGLTVREAAVRAQRTEKAVEYWRSTDPDFRARADQASALSKARSDGSQLDIDFPTFCQKYLDMTLHPHQLQWVDVLEGREPRDLHPSQTWHKGDPTRIVINTPPFHAKSMTLSISYALYRICLDPNVRILIVSQTESMATKFLGAIKGRLTHPKYQLLQATFGPQGGYQATAHTWQTKRIWVGGDLRDPTQKDPTVEALGIGGQIYGARADLVLLDDCVTGKNAHEWANQLEWLHTEVDSRIEEDTGKCLVIGTRIKPEDLYVKLRDPEDFSEAEDDIVHDGESEERPWTYLSQPAVLEFTDHPSGWKTLWPKSEVPWSSAQTQDENGLYDRWDGSRLAKKRRRGARIWSLVYMQQDVAEDATFPAAQVQSCINQQRNPGRMTAGYRGHRERGMDGLYIIGGLDPAAAGHTAMVVLGVDRETRMRYVLTAVNERAMKPHEMRAKMLSLTEDLGINEWVVEKNAYQGSIARDEELVLPLQDRGVRIRDHQTHGQKWDENLGVASMSVLFGDTHADKKIELASNQNAHAMKALVEQLVTWQPNAPKTQKTDLVMALWFAELRAREIASMANGGRKHHAPNRFASPRSLERRTVVSLRDYQTA